jgi:hypothetical protein
MVSIDCLFPGKRKKTLTPTLESIESYLKVGQSIIFYPEAHRQNGARHEVAVRGWQKGGYILLEMVPLPTRSVLFRENAECSLRFLKDGVACSMSATIMDWQVSRKKPTFTVSWPNSVRTAAVRRNERVDIQIPCVLSFEDGQVDAKLQDISIGGCGAISPRPAERESSLVASMTLPDGVYIDRAPLVVRNVREIRANRYYLGCMLDNAPAAIRGNIEFYVTTTLLRARGMAVGAPTLLFVDPDIDDNLGIFQELRDQGFEVHIRSNLIDGLSFARLRLPAVLLLHYDWKSATVLDFFHFIHSSPALQHVPSVVYGAPEDAHAALLEAGAAGCHADLPDAATIIAQAGVHGGSNNGDGGPPSTDGAPTDGATATDGASKAS